MAEFSQPCCTAIQIVLVDVLRSWGVNPTAVVGHSSGEIAAAYACGALTAAQAIQVAYHRGLVTANISKTLRGGMAAIGLGREQVTTYLIEGVTIGCENSPSSVTLTGDLDQLTTVVNRIKTENPEVLARPLRVDCAYHSRERYSSSTLCQRLTDARAHENRAGYLP